MFSSSPNYTKLKTHLKLAINRLKLIEKKKTELTQKARKEIADYIAIGKSERAKIRIEHIIREDYLVEAMELVEMYCDLVLARFGLVTQMKELDDGLAEAISSIIWIAPRLQTDIQELKVIVDVLTQKYGKMYVDACRLERVPTISDKLKHKMAVQAPPKILVEKYLIEIASNYNVAYEPDQDVLRADQGRDALLIDINGPAQPPGFIGYPQPPSMPMPQLPQTQPFSYPTPSGGKVGGFIAPQSGGYTPPNMGGPSQPPYHTQAQPGSDSKDFTNSFLQEEMGNLPPAYDSIHSDPSSTAPTPQPRYNIPPPTSGSDHSLNMPELPSVPSDLPSVPSGPPNPSAPDEIDFEDLNRRFEELKKKK